MQQTTTRIFFLINRRTVNDHISWHRIGHWNCAPTPRVTHLKHYVTCSIKAGNTAYL